MNRVENIKSRLLKTLAERLNCQEEKLDRKLLLFADLAAWELSVIYRELTITENDLQKKVVQALMPDVQTRATPAHAIGFAYPKKTDCILNPEEDEFVTARNMGQEAQEVYFSPLYPTSLVRAKVRYWATGSTLEEVSAFANREKIMHTQSDSLIHPGLAWLGVEMDELADSKKGFTFYMDWNFKEERQQELIEMLPNLKWYHSGKLLDTKIGYGRLLNSVGNWDQAALLDEELLRTRRLEKAIFDNYKSKFITLQNIGIDEPENETTIHFPQDLVEKFGMASLTDLIPKNIVWIKIVFPAGFSLEEIRDSKVLLNCFPMLNRRLELNKDFFPSSNTNIEVRPLSNADRHQRSLAEEGKYFLGIQRIFSASSDYRPTLFDAFNNAPAGCYALQQGKIEYDDHRDLHTHILDLAELIDAKSAKLKLGGDNEWVKVQQQLINLASTIEEEILKKNPVDRDLGYYLYIKVLNPDDMIYVRIWSTQGGLGNRAGIPGDLLQEKKSGRLEGKTLQLMTKPIGGGAPLGQRELKIKMKQLLSRY